VSGAGRRGVTAGFPWSDEELRERVRDAVAGMWSIRESQAARQAELGRFDVGDRSMVTGGRHMDGFAGILADVARGAGFSDVEVRLRTGIVIPGFYRPTKQWDLVVTRNDRLCAAVELKSISGAYGKNLNNRTEEALGSATDLWAAFKEGTLGVHQPWLGYLFVIRDEPASSVPVRTPVSSLPIDPIFAGSSYVERYGILCERMVLERVYSAAAYIAASADTGGQYVEPRAGLGFAPFAKSLFGHLIGCT
jgi:hypothetical protein